MKVTVCPYCRKKMYDREFSTRFKCLFCKKEFPEEYWLPEFRQQLREALGKKSELKD